MRKIRVPGAVTVTDVTGIVGDTPPVVVGDPPQWDDGSDATYAELETMEHPDVSYRDSADGVLAETPLPGAPDPLTATAWVRYQSLSVDMHPPEVALIYINGGTQVTLMSAKPTSAGSMAATWAKIPLAENAPGRFDTFVDVMNGLDPLAEVHLRIYGPQMNVYAYRFSRTRVFGAYVTVGAGGAAPPCRLIRDDDLGVGGARLYPPPKSQQRSSRGVGYY